MSDAAEQEFADVIGRLTALKPIEPSPALGERVARLEEASEVGARISLRCTYCHDALERAAAAFCAACLAPHHRGCFAAHGTCSAPGCEETTALYPGQGAAIARPVRGAALALAASLLIVLGGAGGLVYVVGGGPPGRAGLPKPAAPKPALRVAEREPAGGENTPFEDAWNDADGGDDEWATDAGGMEAPVPPAGVQEVTSAEEAWRRGRDRSAQGEYTTALQWFERAIALDADFAPAYFERGQSYLKLGNLMPGILAFSKALELDPGLADRVYNKIYQISYVVDLNGVITELNKWIAADKEATSHVIFLRGFFYVAKAEFKQVSDQDLRSGIADFDRTLEANPDHVPALIYRGYLWLKLAERLLPHPDAPGESVDTLREQYYARARNNLDRAIELQPGSGSARFVYALCWAQAAAAPGLDADEVEQRQRLAVEQIEAAARSGFADWDRLRLLPAFEGLRERPEVQELIGDR